MPSCFGRSRLIPPLLKVAVVGHELSPGPRHAGLAEVPSVFPAAVIRVSAPERRMAATVRKPESHNHGRETVGSDGAPPTSPVSAICRCCERADARGWRACAPSGVSPGCQTSGMSDLRGVSGMSSGMSDLLSSFFRDVRPIVKLFRDDRPNRLFVQARQQLAKSNIAC